MESNDITIIAVRSRGGATSEAQVGVTSLLTSTS